MPSADVYWKKDATLKTHTVHFAARVGFLWGRRTDGIRVCSTR